MPIRIDKKLPAVEILRIENIFVMDDQRAAHQDIRPLKILILNPNAQKSGHRDPVVAAFSKHSFAIGHRLSLYGESPFQDDSCRAYGDLL